MTRKSFGIDTYVHAYSRGVKKLPIFRQQGDLRRLLFNLYYFNHADPMPLNWKRGLATTQDPTHFRWPDTWGERRPIVAILAYRIMPNHIHLMMKELVENGVSRFMHRVVMGYSKFINEKYGESGSLFQGAYKSRLVEGDADFCNLAAYVMVKNSFELYPGGLRKAIENFDDAYEQAANDHLGSLGVYAGAHSVPIITKDLLGEIFETPGSFKEFARDTMFNRLDQLSSDLD